MPTDGKAQSLQLKPFLIFCSSLFSLPPLFSDGRRIFPASFVFAVSIPCFSVFSQKQNKLYKFRINCNFFSATPSQTRRKTQGKRTKPPPAKCLRAAVGMKENAQKNCGVCSPARKKISSAVSRGGRKKQSYKRAKTTAARCAASVRAYARGACPLMRNTVRSNTSSCAEKRTSPPYFSAIRRMLLVPYPCDSTLVVLVVAGSPSEKRRPPTK